MLDEQDQAPEMKAGPDRVKAIKDALIKAHTNALRLAVYQETRDPALLSVRFEKKPFMGGAYYQDVITEEDAAMVREKALQYLLARDAAGLKNTPTNAEPPEAELRHLMAVFNNGPIDEFTFAMGREEIHFAEFPRGVDWEKEPPAKVKQAFHVIVIGAGAGGLTAGVQLGRLGIPYTIIERNSGVGGTWFTNTYPDCRVDIVSHNYQLSYMKNYPWKHYYATQPELREYFEAVADRYNLRPHIRFNTELKEARWDEATGAWRVKVRKADGTEETMVGNAIISGAGLFNQPKYPNIPGIESFTGKMFHSTAWDHSYDYKGKRVAVIGAGSTGAQIVPAIAPEVSQLTVFLRSPQLVGKREGYRDPIGIEIQWLFDNVPHYWNWYCFSLFQMMFDVEGVQNYDRAWQAAGGKVSERSDTLRAHLEEYIASKVGHVPELHRKLKSDFPPFAKRLVADNGWYDALLRPNVELVTEGIEGITPGGIRTKGGRELAFDLIVLCAGFDTDSYLWPVRYEGRGGVTLEETWKKEGARAFLGMTVPQFPNLFILYGPNGQARAGGLMGWLEIWARYAIKSITMLMERGQKSMECRQQVHDTYNRYLDRALENCIWSAPEAKSYYINAHGRQNTNMPWLPGEYFKWIAQPNAEDYDWR